MSISKADKVNIKYEEQYTFYYTIKVERKKIYFVASRCADLARDKNKSAICVLPAHFLSALLLFFLNLLSLNIFLN